MRSCSLLKGPAVRSALVWGLFAWAMLVDVPAHAQAAARTSEVSQLFYCGGGPGSQAALEDASSECLQARQRRLAEQRNELIVAGRVPRYRARMWAGHLMGILGLVTTGVGFFVMLEGTSLDHGEGDRGVRMAGVATMGGGLALALGGLALVLRTRAKNSNQQQIDDKQDEIDATRRRRQEIKRARREFEAYTSLTELGLRVSF